MRRTTTLLLLATFALAGCNKGGGQAAALDRAADQSDPAAAAVLHNQADAIRDNGSDAALNAADGPAQNALAAGGSAAAANPDNSAAPVKRPVDPQTGLTR